MLLNLNTGPALFATTEVVSQVFGPEWVTHKRERSKRLGEEAIEAMQAGGISQQEAQAILDRVYSKPPGHPAKEVADTMICLLLYAHAYDVNISQAVGNQLDDLLDNADKYRAKFEQKKQAGTVG